MENFPEIDDHFRLRQLRVWVRGRIWIFRAFCPFSSSLALFLAAPLFCAYFYSRNSPSLFVLVILFVHSSRISVRFKIVGVEQNWFFFLQVFRIFSRKAFFWLFHFRSGVVFSHPHFLSFSRDACRSAHLTHSWACFCCSLKLPHYFLSSASLTKQCWVSVGQERLCFHLFYAFSSLRKILLFSIRKLHAKMHILLVKKIYSWSGEIYVPCLSVTPFYASHLDGIQWNIHLLLCSLSLPSILSSRHLMVIRCLSNYFHGYPRPHN